jgi:hypothetical protein
MSPRNRISRRTILRGLGAAMALPWMESFQPLMAAGVEKPPIRMAFWYTPNGVHLPTWFPEHEGVLVDLPYTLQPLSFARDELVVFHGLSHSRAETNGDDPGCGHGLGAASFLTGAQAFRSQDQLQVGVSIDQIYAQHVGRQTRIPSLEIGFEPSRSGNAFGYSGTYKANISWRTATAPAPYEMNPKLVFDRLFGDTSSSKSESAIAERDFYRKSILDYVSDDAKSLRKSISRGDQQKLDQYLTSVREVENRIQNAAPAVDISKSGLTRPSGIPEEFDAHARIMNDLVVLAFQTDTTRVSTSMLAVEAMNRSYPHLGFSDGHHELSHHGDDAEKNRKLREIDRYHVSLLADLVEKLKAIPEGEGTVLDNSMIIYGSGLSDGDRHDHVNLPVILVGRGGGALKTGRYHRCRQETPMCNVLLTMLQQAGVPVDRFGDSTEPMPGLA